MGFEIYMRFHSLLILDNSLSWTQVFVYISTERGIKLVNLFYNLIYRKIWHVHLKRRCHVLASKHSWANSAAIALYGNLNCCSRRRQSSSSAFHWGRDALFLTKALRPFWSPRLCACCASVEKAEYWTTTDKSTTAEELRKTSRFGWGPSGTTAVLFTTSKHCGWTESGLSKESCLPLFRTSSNFSPTYAVCPSASSPEPRSTLENCRCSSTASSRRSVMYGSQTALRRRRKPGPDRSTPRNSVNF